MALFLLCPNLGWIQGHLPLHKVRYAAFGFLLEFYIFSIACIAEVNDRATYI
jgi:hypothetical protein